MTLFTTIPGYDPNKLECWVFENHLDNGGWEHRLRGYRGTIAESHLTSKIPPGKYPRMLVIGCGNGSELAAVCECGYNATGISLCCKEEYDLCRSKGYDIQLMDMHNLSFESGYFDSVYSSNSLEHSVSIWLVLAEIWRVMRVGGLIWIKLPTPLNSDSTGPRDQHLMILDEWFMKPCLETAGFRIIESENSRTNYDFLCEKLPMEKVEGYKAQAYRRLEALQSGKK